MALKANVKMTRKRSADGVDAMVMLQTEFNISTDSWIEIHAVKSPQEGL